MKKLLPIIPLAIFLVTSCQQNSSPAATLPPVIAKKPAPVSVPKKRSYRSKPSTPKVDSAATTLSTEEGVNPLKPDPSNITPVSDIPVFEVPDNVQPKVSDGINQGLFIELKW